MLPTWRNTFRQLFFRWSRRHVRRRWRLCVR